MGNNNRGRKVFEMLVDLTEREMGAIMQALENETLTEDNTGMGRGFYSWSRCEKVVRKKFERAGWK